MSDQDEQGWRRHPLHPTRVQFKDGLLRIEQRVNKRFRFGPILSTAVMSWLDLHTYWDADDDSDLWWSVAFTVMGDWDAIKQGVLQLICGGDGRAGLRRRRKPGRIQHDLARAWRGTRQREPWLDTATTGVIPIVLHYQPLADQHPALWAEVLAMAHDALLKLPGRSAYQLARILHHISEPQGACVYCGDTTHPTFDHAIPLDAGGLPWGDNLVVACLRCNTDKGATPLNEWLTSLRAPLHDPDAVARAEHTQRAARTLPGEPTPASHRDDLTPE